jgi:hypothetical protein
MSWVAPSDTAETPALHEVGELVFTREPPAGASVLECLWLAWDEARSEANSTYDAWNRASSLEAYVIYRAAQDRADAAQDTLAQVALGAI